MGAAAGDYDNDGRPDLYVTAFGSNRLLRNRGDGTFEDATAASGTDDPAGACRRCSSTTTGDGWLDLWVGSYLDFTFARHRPCTTPTGAPDYCDPSAYGALPDRLFRNLGAGAGHGGAATFEDVTAAAGLAGAAGKALGAVAADLDGDGRLDLYVANDGTPNHLWINGGDGTFRDDALLAGCAVNAEGISEASMGVDAGGLRRRRGRRPGDGALRRRDPHPLRRRRPRRLRRRHRCRPASAPPSLDANGFGAGWIDVDNDWLLDLLVVDGAVRALEDQVRCGRPLPVPPAGPALPQRGRTAGCVEVSDRAGPAFDGAPR